MTKLSIVFIWSVICFGKESDIKRVTWKVRRMIKQFFFFVYQEEGDESDAFHELFVCWLFFFEFKFKGP